MLWHVASYASCAALFAASQAVNFAPLSVLAMMGMAFVMSFNFMALHETVHRSAFKSRKWNDVFMHVAGFATMRPVQVVCLYICLLRALPQQLLLAALDPIGVVHTLL